MYDFIFQRSAKLQQRLNKEDTSQTEEDTSQTTAVLSYYENDLLATQDVESPTSYDSDGGSGWNKMFGLPVGWLKRDREPKKDVSPQDPVATDPEPTPEDEIATPVTDNTDPAPEPPTPAPEPDPIVEEPAPAPIDQAPTPEDEVATPVTDNTDPVPETPTPAPEPDPIVEEPAPAPIDQAPTPEDEVATPVTDNTDPVPETPTPAPEPDPIVEEPAPAPTAPEPTDTVSSPSDPADIDRQIAPTTLDSNAATSVGGGRVTTFVLPNAASITGVTINSLPEYGNVTVNPDFTLALVLSGTDYAGPLSFDYTITNSNGTTKTLTATLSVTEPTQAAGWGLGNHYMLEIDASDNMVVEHGDNHRKVYISGSEDALTRADIAALENISESVITTTWLRNNPEYGGSEDLALANDVGMQLWYSVAKGTQSNWLLFERGYSYSTSNAGGVDGRLILYGAKGESELAPMHISSWGEGERPLIEDDIKIYQLPNDNIVFTELNITGGIRNLSGSNIIFSDMSFSENGLNVQNVENFTLRNSDIVDVFKQEQLDGDFWTGTKTGIYLSNVDGALLEKNLFDHNGWADDYFLDGSIEGGPPPNTFSHNIYIQYNNLDVTLRDNIISQASSSGAHVRSGGYIENNLFLDNNSAVDFLGGDYQNSGPVGNFTLFADNLITSAGFKRTDLSSQGTLDWGMRNEALDSTLLNTIITNKADPNNPDEIAWKSTRNSDGFYSMYDPFFDNSKVYSWGDSDQNLEGLTPDELNQITIQNFAVQFLGLAPDDIPADEQMPGYYKSGLMRGLLDYARENWGDGTLTAQDIITYFQDGFNVAAEATGDTYHRFIPNDLGDGVRWDNRLNWTSDTLPSDGDTVDLGGNWVNFSDTVKLNTLDLGAGGKLQVGSGKLTVDALETGDNGMIFVERAGQVWVDGYADNTPLSLQVTGGRFANTGDVSGPFTASVQGGQMILAADNAQFTLGQDSKLRIDGTTAKVGFDGAEGGIATLVMQNGGQLSFVASADGLGRVNEFRSGAWDQDGSNVRSGIVLDGSMALDLSNYIGTGSMKLIEVDAIAGMFDNFDVHGLGDNRDAQLVIDYAADLITLELSSGTGQSNLSLRGDAFDGADEDADLWDQLTAELDQSNDLDASITIFDDVIDALPEMTFI